MAIIIKNKNSRIRSRCFSAKEIAFRRDQVSNEEKNISDLTMGEDQYLKRKLQHPLKLGKPAVQVKDGDSVYIKTAKSKLKAREMFNPYKYGLKILVESTGGGKKVHWILLQIARLTDHPPK